MIIGDRLRALREEKRFSQGDIEKKGGPASVLRVSRGKRPHGSFR
jgi:transcriptional regulator with XRE-family HTH domain